MPDHLPLTPREWNRIVSETNGACLREALSAKNVEHVLSTATVRTPQKVLWAAVEPFVAEMCGCENGLRILHSLAAYGTAKTVSLLAEQLLASHEAIWTFTEPVPPTIAKAAGRLLECLVYRRDVTGQARQTILQKLKSLPTSELLATPFTLPAVARLLTVDGDFATQLVSRHDTAVALTAAIAGGNGAIRAAVMDFCRIILEPVPTEGSTSQHDLLSQLVWSAVAGEVRRAPPSKAPYATIFPLLAKHASKSVVRDMSNAITEWLPLNQDMLKDNALVDAVATLVQRSADTEAGVVLVEHLFDSSEQIRTCLATDKVPLLRLLSVIYNNDDYTSAVERRVGVALKGELKAAYARYTRKTRPVGVATQQAVLRNIHALRQEQSRAEDKPSKRSRSA